jgi:hypothetical protein
MNDPIPDDEEDTTGWVAYYEDLGAPHLAGVVAATTNDGTTTVSEAVWETKKTFIYYERESDGKAWYDNWLCWRFLQSWAKLTGQRAVK